MARFMGTISSQALNQLIEDNVVPHVVIDLRGSAEASVLPLPSVWQQVAVKASLGQLSIALADVSAWPTVFPNSVAAPGAHHLLVFLTQNKSDFESAAGIAGRHGFHRCLDARELPSAEARPSTGGHRIISRDALAYLLNEAPSTGPGAATLLDVRRHDERALFGAIRGAVHIPVEQLVFALQQPPQSAEFVRVAQTSAPARDWPVIMQCRTNRRAKWAATLASEAGYKDVLVYKDGVYGWRIDEDVKPYPSFDVSDPVPEAESDYELETIDEDAAAAELRSLGIL